MQHPTTYQVVGQPRVETFEVLFPLRVSATFAVSE